MSATITMTLIRSSGLEPEGLHRSFGFLLCGCEFDYGTRNVPHVEGAGVCGVSVYDSVPSIALQVVSEFSGEPVVECYLVALFEFVCFHVNVSLIKVCFVSL